MITAIDFTISTPTHRELSCNAPAADPLAGFKTALVLPGTTIIATPPQFNSLLLVILGVPTGAVVTRLQLPAIVAPLIRSVGELAEGCSRALLLLVLLFFFFFVVLLFVATVDDTSEEEAFVVLSEEHLHTVSWSARGRRERKRSIRQLSSYSQKRANHKPTPFSRSSAVVRRPVIGNYYKRTLTEVDVVGGTTATGLEDDEADLVTFNRAQLNRNAQGLLFVLLGVTATGSPATAASLSSPVELELLLLLLPLFVIPWPRHVLHSLVGGGWAISFLLQFSPQSWLLESVMSEG